MTRPRRDRRRATRGVVLVYVLILITITAYLSSMLLNATFSRRISSQVTMNSGQAQSDMVAAEAIVTSCFAAQAPPWPNGLTCATPPAGCLAGNLPGLPERRYSSVVCGGGSPPCRIRINVCRRSEGDDAGATCPVPAC